ncbi:DEAD/DEAH box helicase family protein [Roseiconus lacunae]|uniref:DEAD/DEAH box helicase family protein n=1 Tax=Roseiconus lacunae TaxID=2605694 RepID=UPI0011F27DD5|nr:DEAD/DEAH box helicase family protein [Roseiconus lacunae]
MEDSPFLNVAKTDWIASNELAFAFHDRFPVTRGHALVVTRRVVATWFDASPDEQAALMSLVNVVKAHLDETLDPKPNGYNVGFNCGETAGQTVMHVHVHVIPRYPGDVPDPRGGVRYVIPEKANYLVDEAPAETETAPAKSKGSPRLELLTGHPDSTLWERLSTRMAGATNIDVLASFVQVSGLAVIEERLFETLQRNVAVRILVSDYLYISHPNALARLLAWQETVEDDADFRGNLNARLVRIESLASRPDSFHPKAWRIMDEHGSLVAVGSSNLSKPALQTGVEWNLLCSSHGGEGVPDDFVQAFDELWQSAAPLTVDLVEEYRREAKAYRQENFKPERIDTTSIPEPRPWQAAALESLANLRADGFSKALISVATGMGKTWLAAFDARQVGESLGRRPRVLVIAHRSHILMQAESVLSQLLDDVFKQGDSLASRTSWYVGSRGDIDGELVVASIQKLARPEGLKRLANEHFDYVIIDEVHHAEAPTYRRVLAKLDAGFILGLTATPERTDGVDVVSIFDDNLAYHASIGTGIEEGALVPFHYVGIRDTVDFDQVPWRNGRFDPEELEQRVATSERMERLWQAINEHPGQRTIVFCCSRRHALFARDWLRAKGVRSAAVFSGGGGDSYGESLEQLRDGSLEALCVVDMFNEGLDVPAVDRVVMLRPTESKVVFLQQLGRGLRASVGKTRLLVIDFVGNHRIFAQRMLHLLSLGNHTAQWGDLRKWIQGEPPELPEGCLLDVELEAQDLLKQFLPTGAAAGVEAYRGLRDELRRRPTPAELVARGYIPGTISRSAGSWFAFAAEEGDLNDAEQATLKQFADWFKTVETTNLNKSYKMVVLRVLLDQSSFFDPVDLSTFAKLCRAHMLEHPVLRRDLLEGKHAVDHRNASDAEWMAWWIKWPIDRWLDAQNGTRWFKRTGGQMQLAIDCPDALRGVLESMTEELVEGRLARYIKTKRLKEPAGAATSFSGKVSHANGKPILFIPTVENEPGRPVGPTAVQLPDGEVWTFKFVKVACNVAHPNDKKKNRLPELLRGWFGDDAGLPGTDFRVQFKLSEGQWHAEPVGAVSASAAKSSSSHEADEQIGAEEAGWMIEPAVADSAKYTSHVPVYDLVAAASGFGPDGAPEEIGWVEVSDRRLVDGMFAAQVVGKSMLPRISDGSLCLFRRIAAGSRQGKLVLVQLNTHADPVDGGRYTVKRYHSTKSVNEDGWQHETIELQPLNPEFNPIVIDEDSATDLRILGEFVDVLHDGALDSDDGR